MANEQLKELAFSILAVKESLSLHKSGVDMLTSMSQLDKEQFTLHAGRFVSTVFETLANDIQRLDEVAGSMLAAAE